MGSSTSDWSGSTGNVVASDTSPFTDAVVHDFVTTAHSQAISTGPVPPRTSTQSDEPDVTLFSALSNPQDPAVWSGEPPALASQLPPVAPAGKDDVVVSFFPPNGLDGAPIPLSLPRNPDALRSKLELEADSNYVLFGWRGVIGLYLAVIGGEVVSINPYSGQDNNPDSYEEGVFPDPNVFVDSFRKLAANTLKTYWGELQKRLEREATRSAKTQTDKAPKPKMSVQDKAAEVADKLLSESENEILREASRYLSLRKAEPAEARAALQSGAITWGAGGPEANDLLDALRRLRTARRELTAAQDQITATRAQTVIELARPNLFPSALPGTGLFPVDLAPFEKMADERLKDDPKYRALSKTMDNKSEEFASLLLAEAHKHPIAYRLMELDDLPGDGQHLAGRDGAQRRIQISLAYDKYLLTTLRSALEGCNAIRSDIRNDAALVWKYPRVIDEALTKLAIGPSSTLRRYAEDRIGKVAETASVWDVMSSVAGIGEIGASLAGATVVASGMLIAGVLLAVPALIVEYLKLRDQERAFKAVLDPSRSLASDPSYISLIVQVVFMIPALRDAAQIRSAHLIGSVI